MTALSMKASIVGRIEGIDPSLDKLLIGRLRDLGIDIGQRIECLRHSRGRRPAIFRVGDSVFTLEQNLARRIFIREEPLS